MNAKQPPLSPQMSRVLRLVEFESPTPRQLNDRLYDPTLSRSRRVFAASMSRTIRRMKRRGLITCEGGTIAITEHTRSTLRSERLKAMLAEAREIGKKAARQFQESQAYQDLCRRVGIR